MGKDEGMFPRHEFTGIDRPKGSEVCPLQCLSFQYEGVSWARARGRGLGNGEETFPRQRLRKSRYAPAQRVSMTISNA